MPPPNKASDDQKVVLIGGQQLLRVRDEKTGEFVFRPLDEKTGKAKTKEAIDQEKLEAYKERNKDKFLDSDMKRWEEERKRAIVDKRFKEASKLKWEERERKEKLGISAPTRTKTNASNNNNRGKSDSSKGGGETKKKSGDKPKKLSEKRMQKKREWLDKHGRVRMPEPSKALAELREEMKQAKMNNLEKVNAGKFSFLKMALELEEGKFQTATREARERNYEFERKAKNVRNGEMDGTDSEDESDDEAGGNGRRKHRMREADANDPDFRRDLDPPIVKRGSDADLLDPDYRRDAMPSAPAPPPPAAALTQNKKKPQKKPQQNKKLPPKQQQQQQQQKQQHQKQNSNAAIKAIPKPKFENLSLNG